MNNLSPLKALLDSPIAYHRCFVSIAGSVSGAVFLSQVCYWSKRAKRTDGFFYKTDTEWCEETGIPARTQDRIRSILRSKGIISEKLTGNPSTVHYKLNEDALILALDPMPNGMASTCQVAECGVPSGVMRQINHTAKNPQTIEGATTCGDEFGNSRAPSSEITTENTVGNDSTSENLENQQQPCRACGATGNHKCPGWKSAKQRAKEEGRAKRRQQLRAQDHERPAHYREHYASTPTVGVKPQEEEGGGYRDLREILREQEQGR